MKTLFSSLNIIEVHHLKNLLDGEGIRCRIKNENLSRLAGEIPFTECAMKLVIDSEHDWTRAEAILRDFFRPRRYQATPAWRCAACGETIEGQFTACWNCGNERLDSTDQTHDPDQQQKQ